jgi:hypothetical protein
MSKLLPLIGWLILCCATPAIAEHGITAKPSPSRLQVSYDLLKGGIRGAVITETYLRNKNTYHIESESKTVGFIALVKPEEIHVASEGTVTSNGLHPLTFSSKRKLDSDRNTSADFDWANNRATLNDNTGKRTVPLPPETQDRLSAMYQFLFLPLVNTPALDFYMTNGNKLDIYNYLITPDQSVTVPLGTFKTLYVASVSKPNESRTEIWLATEHFNFPVKVVITDPEGGKLTQVLTKFELAP